MLVRMLKRGAALLTAFMAIGAMFAADAQAAPSPKPRHSAVAHLTTLSTRHVDSVSCTVGQVREDRTSSCASGGLRVDFYIEPEHQYQAAPTSPGPPASSSTTATGTSGPTTSP